MTKKISKLTKVKDESAFKTLSSDLIVVLLAFTENSAVLYKRYGDSPATVTNRGGNGFDSITPRSVISVRNDDDDFEILISSSVGTVNIRCEDPENRQKQGAVLFYGKPGRGIIHVRNICNRSEFGCSDIFKIESLAHFWILTSIMEPLLIIWGLRFDWNGYYDLMFKGQFFTSCFTDDDENISYTGGSDDGKKNYS